MEIVWDERKRAANLETHGFDFAELTMTYFETAIVRAGHSGRLCAIGLLDGRPIVAVVFRPLGAEALSIVSMRPASLKERRLIG